MSRYEARISKQWREHGVANVAILRHHDDQSVDVGLFLVDSWCLGVKETAAEFDLTAADAETMAAECFPDDASEILHPACAKRLIEGAVAYAESLGFSPHRDFRKARKVLSGIDASLCPMEFTFGRDGCPCFVAAEDDSEERIDRVLAILEARCGPGGYDYIDDDDDEDDLEAISELRQDLIEWLDGEAETVPRFYQMAGMVAAMQLCPQPLSPSHLLELLWEPGGRVWESEEERVYFLALLQDYWSYVTELLAAATHPEAEVSDQAMDVWLRDFRPEEPLGALAGTLEWATGFLRVTTRWPEAWAEVRQRPDLAPHWELLGWWGNFFDDDNKDRIEGASAATPPRTIGHSAIVLARALQGKRTEAP